MEIFTFVYVCHVLMFNLNVTVNCLHLVCQWGCVEDYLNNVNDKHYYK